MALRPYNILGAPEDATDVLGTLQGYTATATAAGTTTLTDASTALQVFTGTTTQTVVLPVTSTIVVGVQYTIANKSTGAVTVNASDASLVATVAASSTARVSCNSVAGTTNAAWTVLPTAAGGAVSDGDKGDVIVSGSGAVWSLDYTAVNATVAPAWANVTGAPAIRTMFTASAQSIIGATTFSILGMSTPGVTGTATAGTHGLTSLYTAYPRTEALVTVAATTAVAGFRWSDTSVTLGGTASNLGGFAFETVWAPATGVASTTRAFCGLTNATGAPTDVEPSTLVDCVGMGWDAADTTIQIMHNDASGTCTKVNTTIARPTTDRTSIYKLTLSAPRGTTQTVTWTVLEIVSGSTATGTLSTNLPATTTKLCSRWWHSVGGVNSVIGLALSYFKLDPLL